MREPFSIAALAPAISAALFIAAGPLQAGEWAGGYAGFQTGRINSDVAAGGGNTVYGLHGGYDFAFGTMVLGGEVEYSRLHLAQAGGSEILSNVGRIKLRAGRDFGPAMAYAIMGGASGSTPAGSETGVVYGLGLAARVGERMTLSGEALRQVFGNYANGGTSLTTGSFNMRVSFRF